MQGAAHMMMTSDITINFVTGSYLRGVKCLRNLFKNFMADTRSYSEVSEVRKRGDG